MPKRFERHARSKNSDWGGEPSRSQERQAAATDQAHPEVVPQGKRPPGKKDPALCKAAHWKGPHQPKLRVRQYGWSATRGCRWAISWPGRDDEASWQCAHEEYCTGCGKVLRAGIEDAECPKFHPVTDAERAAIEAERAEHEARVAAARARSGWRPKPAITGRQGYRRTRD